MGYLARPFNPSLHPRGHGGLFVTRSGGGKGLAADPHGAAEHRPAAARKRKHAVVPQGKFGAARKTTGPGFGGTLESPASGIKGMIGD